MLDIDSMLDDAPQALPDLDPPALTVPGDDRLDALDEADPPDAADGADESAEPEHPDAQVIPVTSRRRFSWRHALIYGVLPGLAMILALVAGYLKWQDASTRQSHAAAAQAVSAATESTVAMLSYRPDTAEHDLIAASERMTGAFRDDYTKLINDVVAPGAKQKQISAVATVPAAAPVSVSQNHAVVLVFVNQTTTIGDDPPTNSTSSVRVTVDKVDGAWLIAQFEPV